MLLQRVGNRGIRLGTLFERAAARHPANVVVLDHELDLAPGLGRRLTVADIADLVDDFASRLWAAGVRPGDRVVVHKTNGFDITLLACVAARIGAVPVLLSPKLDGATVAELVRRVDRPHLITDQAKLDGELPDTVFDHACQVLLAAGDHPGARRLRDLAGAPRVAPATVSAHHPALITHTSGTTGIPKLAVHTGWTLQARYRPQAAATALVRKRRPVAVHVSFVHSRLFTAMAIAMLRGFPLVMLADDDPRQAADLFARLRPGVIEAHPNTFMRWEELADDPRRPLAQVKYFSSTFDAIHPRTVQRMLRASRHRLPLFAQLYGQSEAGPVVGRIFTRWRGEDADGRCVGRAFPGMTAVRVVSRDGRPVSETSPGYIEVRTNGRVLTYLGEPERYAQQEHDAWWRMGDVGYRTRWGCLHLLDREVDVIPGFGSTLSAEDALFSALDELVEVIIVPGPDSTPVPVVCTRDDKPLDKVAWDRATTGLPRMAEPVQWRRADLPQTATTKIKRLELARALGDGNRSR
ncbi:long-chain acyl-CoA synthetase [Streptomyces pluripotens]|uniref:Long-chain acyl-CoA synthetase n=1 Tax=Streptomyces pluripotens TaxID=1355015 RepID=A0A221P4F8_9ACTN|nr:MULTISPECIES: class I adenylate-forming enzyme family protein [Streptomyces]ARP72891.1 long-chain acyl-CoA synthetase [Streptomyces pluripotens]ASN27141.1 long-chain acyl-CoA synthetase [Streptomyces pluripotens]KIE28893.1 long-chain acyl-CoA synthetase [Streptomyces sp. MUSC 125]MCH0559888.1 acyl--CoA ligase [Streptomyces sp. MUM 16J]